MLVVGGHGVLGRRHRVAGARGVPARWCRVPRGHRARVAPGAGVPARRVGGVRVRGVLRGHGRHSVAGVGAHRAVT